MFHHFHTGPQLQEQTGEQMRCEDSPGQGFEATKRLANNCSHLVVGQTC